MSFSTMGNSRGYEGLMKNRENYNRVKFEVISLLDPTERLSEFELVLRRAKVRMSDKKAEWLQRNYVKILEMGGVEKAKEKALGLKGSKAKIDFLKQFDGIADKYARNIWMDVYHPDFHESVAIDDRIKKMSEKMNVSFRNYLEHEQFYLEIAREAGLQGWELDRLLYNYKEYFLSRM